MEEEWERKDALQILMRNDYYKAILYTEFREFGKRKEALPLLKKMDDDNPVKWYLMAIVWAERAEQETREGQEPYYQTCLRRCFHLDKSFHYIYMNDAQFSDKLRSKFPQLELLSKEKETCPINYSPENPAAFYGGSYKKKQY